MASTLAFIGGLILLCLFLALIAGMALCAGCDREFLGIDEEWP